MLLSSFIKTDTFNELSLSCLAVQTYIWNKINVHKSWSTPCQGWIEVGTLRNLESLPQKLGQLCYAR